jgi:hypothetical protein
MRQTPIDPVGLFYDKTENIFIDYNGNPVFNIFDFINPNTLLLFRQNKEYMLVEDKRDLLVELFYPEEDEYYFERIDHHRTYLQDRL